MQKIRIKTAPKLGDQVDYSFYDSRNRNAGMAGNAESDIKNTMGPIPREEATIEVEKGEVVVGDTNQDGFLELFTFTGKPHSKGGTPVDVPPGSFIYSNTRKLRIKDGEVLTKMFGLTDRKEGYTPAEIAKRYQINEHVATLKDDRADNIQKRSASEMLKNNLQKLGVLALVQESMKGFPDGIPAIAESAAIGLGMDPAMFDPAKQQEMMPQQMPQQGMQQMPQDMQAMPEQMPQMRNGGRWLPKAQNGLTFTPNSIVYINGRPHRFKAMQDADGLGTGDNYTFTDVENGRDFFINSDDFEKSYDKRVTHDRGYGDQMLHYYIGSNPQSGDDWYKYNFGLDIKAKNQSHNLRQGDLFFAGNDMYQVEWPYARTKTNNIRYTAYPGSKGAVDVPGATVVKVNPKYDSQGQVIGYDSTGEKTTMPIDLFEQYIIQNQFSKVAMPQQQVNATENGVSGALGSTPGGAQILYSPGQTAQPAQPAQPAQQQRQPTQRTQSQPAKPAGKPKTASDALNDLKYGGYALPRYQPGSTVQPDPNNTNLTSQTTANQISSQTNQAPDPKGERFLKQVETEADGIIYVYINPATGQVIGRDDKGTIKTQRAMTDAEVQKYTGQNSQYGSKQVQDILAKNPDTRYTYTNFGTFGTQPRLGNTGIYLSSGNAGSHKEGDLSAAEWQDFYDRHGDWVDKSYTGGFEQFKKDLKTSPEKGNAAAEWFQKQVNKFTQDEFGIDYFAPEKTSENPYSVDSKFGQVTYSVPRFFNTPKTPPPPTIIPPPVKPGMKQAFYCVEGEDGSRSVQTVEYPENGSPIAPAGKNVKQYSSRADADAGCVETPDDFKQDPIKKSGPWWAQDIVNFTDAMTRSVNKYEPMMQQVDLLTSEYTPLKKDAQVANIQQMQNQFMNLAQNSNDGNVATAAALAASGDSFQNAANVTAQIENQNSQLGTNNSFQNVGIENQERNINAGYRGQYVGQMATGNQQFDNSQNRILDNRRQALVAGLTNSQHKILQEEVVTPEVFIDPINFKPYFTGRGRQWDLPDLYQNPYMSGNSKTAAARQPAGAFDNDLELYDKYYQQLLPKYGKEQAEKLALAKMNQYNTMSKTNPYAAMDAAGLGYPGGYNPTVQAMGGAITIEDLFYMMNNANKK